MKWDPSQDPDEMDEEELLAFDKMRKDLRTFLDALLAIDEELVTGTVLNAVVETLRGYDAGEAVQWQDAELAVHIVFFYGELQKSNRGLFFCFDQALLGQY
jgi:exportin-T